MDILITVIVLSVVAGILISKVNPKLMTKMKTMITKKMKK
jgi:hypothetical protein